MSENTKHLILNIKGKWRNLIAKWAMQRKLKAMGVEVKNINDVNANHVEIVVAGSKASLWQVVNWSKSSEVFVFLNEVIFEFADSVPTR